MCCDLPDSKEDTEEDTGVGNGFQDAAAFFLRANEERIGGFLVVSHKSFFLVVRFSYATIVPGKLFASQVAQHQDTRDGSFTSSILKVFRPREPAVPLLGRFFWVGEPRY